MNLLASLQAANIVEIVCALVLLIFAFAGAKKGFIRCFFGLISTLVALILAITLASSISGLLNSLFDMNGFFSRWLEKSVLTGKSFAVDISAGGIEAALADASLPGFVKDVIMKNVSEINTLEPGTTLGQVVSPVLAQFIGLLISGILIFIVSKLLLFIIQKILTKIVTSWSLASALNGFLGFLVGALKAMIFICIILAILSLIPSDGVINFIDETWVLKYLYHDNPLTKILSHFIHF